MRKVTFKIDDLAWLKRHYNLTEGQTKDIFSDQKAFKVLYTLIGEGTNVDRYELTDYDGNKLRMDELNGYERGVVLNDCYAYFTGGKYHSDTKEPCGVIKIVEDTDER